jgi:hypothetical protein
MFFDPALEAEKEKILKAFKGDIKSEMDSVVTEMNTSLLRVRKDMIKNFKRGIVSDLKELVVSL